LSTFFVVAVGRTSVVAAVAPIVITNGCIVATLQILVTHTIPQKAKMDSGPITFSKLAAINRFVVLFWDFLCCIHTSSKRTTKDSLSGFITTLIETKRFVVERLQDRIARRFFGDERPIDPFRLHFQKALYALVVENTLHKGSIAFYIGSIF
jgi:hypothetical protein